MIEPTVVTWLNQGPLEKKKIRLLAGLLGNKISLSQLGLESEKGYDLELGQPYNDWKKHVVETEANLEESWLKR